MDEQIIALQTKIAFQESVMEQLNEVVTDQQQQIDKLERLLNNVKIQMETMQNHPSFQQQDEIPPHY